MYDAGAFRRHSPVQGDTATARVGRRSNQLRDRTPGCGRDRGSGQSGIPSLAGNFQSPGCRSASLRDDLVRLYTPSAGGALAGEGGGSQLVDLLDAGGLEVVAGA